MQRQQSNQWKREAIDLVMMIIMLMMMIMMMMIVMMMMIMMMMMMMRRRRRRSMIIIHVDCQWNMLQIDSSQWDDSHTKENQFSTSKYS